MNRASTADSRRFLSLCCTVITLSVLWWQQNLARKLRFGTVCDNLESCNIKCNSVYISEYVQNVCRYHNVKRAPNHVQIGINSHNNLRTWWSTVQFTVVGPFVSSNHTSQRESPETNAHYREDANKSIFWQNFTPHVSKPLGPCRNWWHSASDSGSVKLPFGLLYTLIETGSAHF